jgi:hypothetical protein
LRVGSDPLVYVLAEALDHLKRRRVVVVKRIHGHAVVELGVLISALTAQIVDLWEEKEKETRVI